MRIYHGDTMAKSTYNPWSDQGVQRCHIMNLTDEVVMNAVRATMGCPVEKDEVIEVQDEDIVEAIEITPPRVFNVLGRNAMGPQ